ncbi:MAG: pentapeptide repeat-containing protein [Thermodesulfobacteriota bacterium]
MASVLARFFSEPTLQDPRVTLSDIFVSPQAFLREHCSEAGLVGPSPVEDLMASLQDILEEEKPVHILVSAPPGRGKTAVALALASLFARKWRGEEKPAGFLFYDYAKLGSMGRDEMSVLAACTGFIRDESFFFGKKTLLIIDGMDGENETGATAGVPFRDFVRNLFLLCRRINGRGDGSDLRLLLTGRPRFLAAVQEILIPPYVVHEIRKFGKDRVDCWLERYSLRVNGKKALRSEELSRLGFSGFLDEPPALFLCSMILSQSFEGMGQPGEGAACARSQRKALHAIARFAFRRSRSLYPDAPVPLSEEQYFAFLRAAAFLMARKGSRTLSPDELGRELAYLAGRYGLFSLASGNSSALPAVRTMGGMVLSEGRSFCFAHESFESFLAAEAVFLLLAQAASRFREEFPERSCRRMAADIYDILGPRFLGGGCFLSHIKTICREEEQMVRDMFPGLVGFFARCREHPYLLSHAPGLPGNPLRAEANVLAGLLCWVAEGARVAGEERLLFPGESDLLRLLFLFGEAYPPPGNGLRPDLSRLCLAGSFLERANLAGADLSGADLRNARLAYANLSGANLTRADLTGADLSGADLTGADLTGALLPAGER